MLSTPYGPAHGIPETHHQGLLGGQPPNVRPQELLNVLYACAKLRQQPRPEELLLLVGSFVHPAVISEARPQDLAKVILSMGGLSANHGLSEEVSQEVLQRLDKQVLAKVIGKGSSQDNAKVLLGLGCAQGHHHCSPQL